MRVGLLSNKALRPDAIFAVPGGIGAVNSRSRIAAIVTEIGPDCIAGNDLIVSVMLRLATASI